MRIWDTTSGTQIGGALQEPDHLVQSMASPYNSASIIRRSDDETVRIRDIAWTLSPDGWNQIPARCDPAAGSHLQIPFKELSGFLLRSVSFCGGLRTPV